MSNEKILVTSALPYANGPIHLGHMVEYILTDIYCRFLRLTGKDCIYCCADDTHGAPIEINAKKQGISPEELIERNFKAHREDFSRFQISFDSYYSTNSPENKALSDQIFIKLKDKGDIYQKEIELSFCPKCQRFLPDRYVQGKCPKCGALDQYGDNCEICNSTYNTVDLIDPYCAICGTHPIQKRSRHYFFRLSSYEERLRRWLTENKNIQPEICNYILNWIEQGLKDWDISRDEPYFGFKIVGEEDKYYYVWLDAPIGYMASCKHYCKEKGIHFEDYWMNPESRIRHFIGKDIIYFHFLFWPAMLMGSGFNLPDSIFVHGFLTVNGEKMSKSRGTFITAKDYLNKHPASLLRFYYALNITRSISDIDLDTNDFKDKINSELVGNIANLTYRSLSFLKKNFNGHLTAPAQSDIIEKTREKIVSIHSHYESANLRSVVKEILGMGDLGNKYLQHEEPWKLIKTDRGRAWQVLSLIINIVRDITICLKPIIPDICEGLESQLGLDNLLWKDIGTSLESHTIGEPRQILQRVESIDLITKHPFLRLDVRVAKVIEATNHPDADRLLILKVDTGDELRQIVAGIKAHYPAESLIGRNIILLKNLKAARLKGIESQGMLLAADDGEDLGVLTIEDVPGERITLPDMDPCPDPVITLKDIEEAALSSKGGKAYSRGLPLICNGMPVVADKGISGKVK